MQDREALYQAQHKSYCKLSDTFMQQVRAESASASVHRQRRAQSSRVSMHAAEASRTVARPSAYLTHAGFHPQLEHPSRVTSKGYLVEEALRAIHSPRDVVFGSRTQGRIHKKGTTQPLTADYQAVTEPV